jgi:thioredoxin 1
MLELTDANFETYLNSNEPILVDFWAPWCPPCKVLMPTLEKLANTYAGKIKFGKVNVDDNSKLSLEYSIKTIPTVMIFQNGELMHRFSGVKSEQEISNLINSVIE